MYMRYKYAGTENAIRYPTLLPHTILITHTFHIDEYTPIMSNILTVFLAFYFLRFRARTIG